MLDGVDDAVSQFGKLIGFNDLSFEHQDIIQLSFDTTDVFCLERKGDSLHLYFCLDCPEYELLRTIERIMHAVKPATYKDDLIKFGFGNGNIFIGVSLKEVLVTPSYLFQMFERVWDFKKEIFIE